MRADVLVYLSGPITPRDGFTVADNMAQATRVFVDLLRRGIPAFCPHLTAGAFDVDAGLVDYETWLAYDLAIVARCTHVLMLPRWRSSPGAVRERALALSRTIPVLESVLSLERQLQRGAPSGGPHALNA